MTDCTIISCAVTGGADSIGKNPAVPVTPKQIADQAIDAAAAGAAIVHIHVRDPDTGAASTDFDLYAEVCERIRSASTDVVINLTTGPGSFYEADGNSLRQSSRVSGPMTPEDRVAHVVKLKPEICSLDIASVNFGDDLVMVNLGRDLRTMGRLIADAGVLPELEVFDLGHIRLARHLIHTGSLNGPGFFQFCLGVPWGAPATLDVLTVMRGLLPQGAQWSAFGVAHDQFKIVSAACGLGGHVRVGLEDNLYTAKGQLASSNAELVEKAARIVRDIGSRPATAAEARQKLLVP